MTAGRALRKSFSVQIGWEIGIVIALTLLIGFFSGAEIALLSVRKSRLRELAESGSHSANAALALRDDTPRMLATIQIGITVIGATAAAFGGSRLEAPVAHLLRTLGLHDWSEELAFALVVAFVSYVSLVLGELVPKSLALRSPETFAMVAAGAVAAVSRVSKPIVWALTKSSNLILRLFGDQTSFSESRLSPDELQQLVEESASSGAFHRDAGEVASRAIELGKVRAAAVMTPRTRVVTIGLDASFDTVRRVLRETPHARYPVVDPATRDPIGYVRAHDLREALLRSIGGAEPWNLAPLMREIPCFPDDVLAVDVLRRLQKLRRQMALLVDEHGVCSGVVTIEDIAEDLLGEILEEDEVVRVLFWRESDGSIHAYGEAAIHEIERLLPVSLGDEASATTVAGLLQELTGRNLTTGESHRLDTGVIIEVLDADAARIRLVRIVVPQAEM